MTRATKLFGVKDKKHRIFERRDVAVATLPPFSPERPREPPASAPQAGLGDDRIDKSVRRVMEKHYPPHLVLDRANHIVRFSGGAMGQYLEPAPGAPSFALFDILRKTLRPAAREVLQQVRGSPEPARRDDVPIRIDGKPRLVSLIAERLAEHGPEAEFVVLALHDAGPGPVRAKPGETAGKAAEELQSVQQELRTTRTQLQSTIDELETANEEMKSSNEEYQSVNEELQSSNEEMETAKEEMQSVNEELQTINTEIASKNDQLTQLNSDMSNLLESTEIATLFLDEGLKVRRFTRGVSDVFHLRNSDIGRPITEIVSLLDYADLQGDVKTVLRRLSSIEREVTLQDARATFILRIRPYRTVDNIIDGVVMTFVDITDRQVAAEALRRSETNFRMLFDFIDEGFCTLEKVDTAAGEPSDFRYISANPGFEKQTGVSGVVGNTIREAFPAEPQEWFDIYDMIMATGEPLRFERDLASHARVLELFAFRFDDGTGPKIGVIFLDVSNRRLHEEQQELLLREMDHRVKNLFAVVGGMVTLTARNAATPRDMADTVQGRLGALASAHQLIMPIRNATTARQQTTLDGLIRAILSPHIDPARAANASQVEIDGPQIPIGADAATNLALVVHELATNAAKYGALSMSSGRVRISWAAANGRLALSWEEAGGPPIEAPPKREGFGSVLARRSVNGQLAGDLVFHWNPGGLAVLLSASLERLGL